MRYLSLFENFTSHLLITESVVAFSKDFRDVLRKMKNPIADEILKYEGQDKPISNNYFDLKSDTNDVVTFITDRKYQEVVDKSNYGKYKVAKFDVLNPVENNAKYYANLGMDLPTEIKPIPEGEMGKVERMWTSPNTGKVWAKFVPDNSDYFPIMTNMSNLEKMWDDDIFFKNNRQDTRIGRCVRSLLNSLGVKFSDKEIEGFVNRWKSTVDAINNIFSNFEIVSGDEIAVWYNYRKYFFDHKGQLGASCMRSVNPDFFDIYCYNKKVEMVIFKSIEDSDKILGRAILWTFDDGKKFMDRIYTSNDSDIELFREYAKKIGAYSKYNNNSSSNLKSYDPNGQVVDLGIVTIQLTKFSHRYYPYMDTFKSYNPDTGIITNNERAKGGIWLESTEGNVDNENDEDLIWVEFYGDDIDINDLIYCEMCEEGRRGPVEGYRYPNDCFFSEYYHVYVSNDYRDDNGGICSVTKEWRMTEDLKHIYPSDEFIVKDYDGKDYLYSSYHDKFIHRDNAIKVWTDIEKKGSDWRALDDGSWKEVDNQKFDNSILINKEEVVESFKWIKKFR
jgi:hypothetical protein